MFRFIVNNESHVNSQQTAGNFVNVTVFRRVVVVNFVFRKQCNMKFDNLPTYLAGSLTTVTVFKCAKDGSLNV
jgi:hypothetical protein